ncbi:MAG: TIGR02452 family protein [Kiritimatiellae bacterium]|nr:TIGR02452 family protein [Kiritimatiellia bacterium]
MTYHHHPYDPAIAERKQKNRDIFAETMRICRRCGYVTPLGTEVRLPSTDDVLKASVFYQNPPRVDSVAAAETSVCDAVNDDCIEVARKLVEEGYRPIMLNMANRHTPGGGVINGARAQEESLFRQSNLCVSLYQFDDYHAGLLGLPLGDGRYPMDRNTGGIYSGRVTFFRTSSRKGDALVETPFECAVVSVAAINRPDLTSDGRLVDWAVVATKKKIRTMLRIGLLHGHDAIVLGAWGCGAFCNPPEHMARLFHEVLRETEFAGKYRVVRFAVIEDHNSRHSNFAPFDREFNRGPAAPNN